MIELEADMWGLPADAHVITTNGSVRTDGLAVMGRGCALEAVKKFPGIQRVLGESLGTHGLHAMSLGTWVTAPDNKGRNSTYRLVSFPVKYQWSGRANLALIERSAAELVLLARASRWEKVVVVRPGCGNGRLRWEDVKPVLETVFDDRFVVVHK